MLSAKDGLGRPKSPRLEEQLSRRPMFSQFMGAEMIAKKHGFDRDAARRLSRSTATGARRRRPSAALSADEIVALEIETPEGSTALHTVDEGIRFDATLEAIGGGQAARRKAACISAANASQICDGASARDDRQREGAEGRTA